VFYKLALNGLIIQEAGDFEVKSFVLKHNRQFIVDGFVS
jgi:hypothetical protein